jgi:hypothetical protein
VAVAAAVALLRLLLRLLLTVDVAYRRADDMPFMLSTVYGDYRAQSPCPLYYRSSTLYQIH